MTSGKFSKIIEDYNNNSLKTIQSLLNSNENESFAKNNGYYYSFFFMKYLKNNYYKGKIVEYIIDNKKLFISIRSRYWKRTNANISKNKLLFWNAKSFL